jgi:hypothetical protein
VMLCYLFGYSGITLTEPTRTSKEKGAEGCSAPVRI